MTFEWPTPISVEADDEPAPGPTATREELVRSILIWDQVAAQAAATAAGLRTQLAEQARAEYAAQGAAPTWKIPGIATVTLPVSKPTVKVGDERALLAWALQRRPHAVETVQRIRESDLRVLLTDVDTADGETVHIVGDGEVVPGLVFLPGGAPKALSMRADPSAKQLIADAAAGIVAEVAEHLGHPTSPDHL